ncbi:TPA: hypothetical protein SMG11_000073 [Serratia marcescens]|uniref:hypothetical protein n=1 Tax=Serratia marcescens TaxID=615 RepID=UPI0018D44358|nr:hypothetical protein [Serratia marcescens]MBH1899103.1 hypothetical protein [Serratia marcescens]MBH2689784.1 hypothetical protein [Serratia marcescens]MBH2737478.1 hypothetical protein [Serratia marcescens]MBH2830590.1 hypothetical protein [Serratia marcescens]MBH3223119.1 hypothetical protein [Serratia marcescens]
MKKKIADLLAFKTNILEVFVVAVLIALGVNILSSGIINYFELSFLKMITVGSLLMILGAAIFLRNAYPMNNGKYNFDGVVCLDDENKGLVPIEGYDFAEEVSRYLKGLCAENKAIHKLWTENSIGYGYDIQGGVVTMKKNKANKLFVEAIEYYVLKMLALHLSSHFNGNKSVSEDYLVKLDRKSIPGVLMGNRFIDTFSRPMDEREQFIDHGPSPSIGKVVYAYGKGGAIFDHFEMVLPKNSSVIRESDSSISVITKRFKINYRPLFEGLSDNLPRRFEELYLGKDFHSLSTYSVGLVVTVDFNVKSLLTTKGWEYYWWLDSFLGKLESSFSKEIFLSKISWDQNAAMFLIAENRRKIQHKGES